MQYSAPSPLSLFHLTLGEAGRGFRAPDHTLILPMDYNAVCARWQEPIP